MPDNEEGVRAILAQKDEYLDVFRSSIDNWYCPHCLSSYAQHWEVSDLYWYDSNVIYEFTGFKAPTVPADDDYDEFELFICCMKYLHYAQTCDCADPLPLYSAMRKAPLQGTSIASFYLDEPDELDCSACMKWCEESCAELPEALAAFFNGGASGPEPITPCSSFEIDPMGTPYKKFGSSMAMDIMRQRWPGKIQ